MAAKPAFCVLSGCTPEIVHRVLHMRDGKGPVVARALQELSDAEFPSQNDLCLIGPIHPSGQPLSAGLEDGDAVDEDEEEHCLSCDVDADSDDLHVLLHCTMGDSWPDGYVEGPPSIEWRRYFVEYGTLLMVQTYAMDILAVATDGRVTPLNLWLRAMENDFDEYRPPCHRLHSVDYGELEDRCDEIPVPFIPLSDEKWRELDEQGDVEAVKEYLVHEGMFWVWMAPDRFPVSPTQYDPPAPRLPDISSCKSHSALEKLPTNIVVSIVSQLPLESLVNLSSTSRLLRTGIFGNEHLARAWISINAPWWIPVPTRTPRSKDEAKTSTKSSLLYPASQSSPCGSKVEQRLRTIGLDWAYVRRCARSGSMLNRRRIWKITVALEEAESEEDEISL